MTIPFEHLFDIILLLVSGSACLFCWQLNRRLAALHDLKSGLGRSIVSLSSVIAQTKDVSQKAHIEAQSSITELSNLIEDVKRFLPEVEQSLSKMGHKADQMIKKTSQEHKEMEDSLVALILETNYAIDSLTLEIDEPLGCPPTPPLSMTQQVREMQKIQKNLTR
ncbi:MAG: hypothetical protein V3V30_02355 [Parvularculaceae bacterium]